MANQDIAGRSKEAGRKLVHLVTAVPATMRAGSRNAEYFTVILKSETSDEAVAKIRKTNDKPWDIIRLAVQRGVVRLGGKVAVEAAPAKTSKAAPKAKTAPTAKAPAKDPAAPKPKRVRRAKTDRREVDPVL